MKLTVSERIALSQRFNLADAHTRQSPNEDQHTQIIDKIPALYELAQNVEQSSLEASCYQALMSCNNQKGALEHFPIPCYSASMATEVVGNYLRLTGSQVALTHPCFDNIADILRRHEVTLSPIADDFYDDIEHMCRRIDELAADYVFLVMPNNPTGKYLEKEEFTKLVSHCVRRRIGLIFDFCFRLYEQQLCSYDQYEILDGLSAEYIAIEDSGKIWPTLDQKVSFLICSGLARKKIAEIQDDFLLNVSPLSLLIVEEFARLSLTCDCSDFRGLVKDNRAHLRKWLDAHGYLGWRSKSADSHVSVEFIATSEDSASAVSNALERGVAILPGTAFYWSSHVSGRRTLRIALARDPDYFRTALDTLDGLLVR